MWKNILQYHVKDAVIYEDSSIVYAGNIKVASFCRSCFNAEIKLYSKFGFGRLLDVKICATFYLTTFLQLIKHCLIPLIVGANAKIKSFVNIDVSEVDSE